MAREFKEVAHLRTDKEKFDINSDIIQRNTIKTLREENDFMKNSLIYMMKGTSTKSVVDHVASILKKLNEMRGK